MCPDLRRPGMSAQGDGCPQRLGPGAAASRALTNFVTDKSHTLFVVRLIHTGEAKSIE